MKIILLIMIGLSLVQAEFLRENDVVLDTQTKLMWQDNEIGTKVNWEAAIQRCEDLSLARHEDWRLPSINELRSIIDISKTSPALVDAFTKSSSSYYWSSSTYEDSKSDAWGVNFYSGDVDSRYMGNGDKGDFNYVRCVRDGQ